MNPYLKQPAPITITHLRDVATSRPLPSSQSAITLVITSQQPWSFRFKNTSCVLDQRSFSCLYLRFCYQSEGSVDQPMAFRCEQGVFRLDSPDIPLATSGFNDSMMLQLEHYLSKMMQDPVVDYLRFELLLCLLMNCLLDAHQTSQAQMNEGLTPRQLQAVKEHVAQSLDQPFRLQDLAERLSLSKYHFCRMFKACTGESLSTYVTRQKMQKARALISQTDLPIIQITYEVGYQNPGHFATTFRKTFGQTPSQWRAQLGTS